MKTENNSIEIREEHPGGSGRLRIAAESLACSTLMAFWLGMNMGSVKVMTAGMIAGVTVSLIALIKDRRAVWIFLAALLGTGAILHRMIGSGYVLMLNALIDMWNEKHRMIYHFYVAMTEREGAAMMLAAGMSTALLSLGVMTLLKAKKAAVAAAIMTVGMLLYALSAIDTSMPVLLVSSLLILYLAVFGETGDRVLKRSGWICLLMTMLPALLSALGVYMTVEKGQESLGRSREIIAAAFDKAVYGASDLTEGDLVRREEVEDPDEIRLTVEASRTSAVYLKGFVGCDYMGTGWAELPAEAYQDDQKQLLQWMEENRQYPDTILSQYLSLSEAYDGDSYDVQKIRFRIENVSARRKYLYQPYTPGNVTLTYGDRIYKDMGLLNPITGQILQTEFDTLQLPMEAYTKLRDHGELTDADMIKNAPEYYSFEATYRSYAKRWYLSVPAEVDKALEPFIPEKFAAISGAEEAIRFVRSWLKEGWRVKENISSEEKADNQEVDHQEIDDYILHLIREEEQIDSAGFATLGALMFRHFGIPARYVEGYAYLPDEENGGQMRVELTAKDAHAWVEIYRYGMGWVPVEVTPGWYPEEEPITAVKEVTSKALTDQRAGGQDEDHGQGAVDRMGSEEALPVQQNKRVKAVISLFFLLLLLIILGLFLLRRWLMLLWWKRRTQDADLRRSAAFVYYLILRALRKMGIQVEWNAPAAMTECIDHEFPSGSISFEESTSVIKRILFSDADFQEADKERLMEYLAFLREQARSGNVFERAKRKYWYVIY